MGDKANIREFDREFNKFIILESVTEVTFDNFDGDNKRTQFELNLETLQYGVEFVSTQKRGEFLATMNCHK